MRGVRLAVTLGLALLLLAGGRSDRPLTIAMAQEPDNLNPVISNMAATQDVVQLLYVPLFHTVTEGNSWRQIPAMAVRMPSLENGLVVVHPDIANPPRPTRRPAESDQAFAERLAAHDDWRSRVDPAGSGRHTEVTVRWELQPEAVWSDGEAVTADDYVWTWQFVMSDAAAGLVPSLDPHNRIRWMKALDDGRTLEVRWREPWAFCAEFNHPVLPGHVHRPIINQTGGGDQYLWHEVNRDPVGNGPYVLASWHPRERMVFRANPRWWGDQPRIDTVEYQLIAETRTMESRLLAGEIDATAQVGMTFDDGVRFRDKVARGTDGYEEFTVHVTPGLIWEHIDLNLDDPVLRDVRVRRALLHAINRAGLCEKLFKGLQPVAHTWLPPMHPGFNPEVPRLAHDAGKAASLLDSAGWKLRAGEAIRRNADGDHLRLTLQTTSGNMVRERVAALIQKDLEAIGIDLTISTVDPNTFFGPDGPLVHRQFQLGMYAWLFDETSDGRLWTSAEIPTEANGFVGSNFPGLRVPELDKLEAQIPLTLDPDERRRLFHKEQLLWVEHLPALPLYYRSDVTVRRNTLQNWRPTRGGSYVSWNAAEWFFDAGGD